MPDFFKNGQKPLELVKRCVNLICNFNDIILDFFAGSGTTGHAVMELNKDGGNRKFILCQIDEPISKDKPAYQFCIENNLPPVISSITMERLKRAGEKIRNENEELKVKKAGQLDFDTATVPPLGVRGLDTGFKVFDSTEAPKLEMDGEKIVFPETNSDSLSRIYNMIFTVGLDEPTQTPEKVVEDAIYKINTNYYITNCDKVNSDDLSNAIKNGKVFIDGWTASLNATLQHYKEDVKIIF
jgi:adenine-specific DNA-methyltransferase